MCSIIQTCCILLDVVKATPITSHQPELLSVSFSDTEEDDRELNESFSDDGKDHNQSWLK